jgi:hypothetical protein
MAAPFDLLNGPGGRVDPDLVGDLFCFEAEVNHVRISTCSFEDHGWATDRVRVENSI